MAMGVTWGAAPPEAAGRGWSTEVRGAEGAAALLAPPPMGVSLGRLAAAPALGLAFWFCTLGGGTWGREQVRRCAGDWQELCCCAGVI